MSLNAAMVCYNCEQTLSLPYEPDSDHEEALEEGWFIISSPDEDHDIHVCSETCLTVWAAARAVRKGTVEIG